MGNGTRTLYRPRIRHLLSLEIVVSHNTNINTYIEQIKFCYLNKPFLFKFNLKFKFSGVKTTGSKDLLKSLTCKLMIKYRKINVICMFILILSQFIDLFFLLLCLFPLLLFFKFLVLLDLIFTQFRKQCDVMMSSYLPQFRK